MGQSSPLTALKFGASGRRRFPELDVCSQDRPRSPIRHCRVRTAAPGELSTTAQAAPSAPPVASAGVQKARKQLTCSLVLLLAAAVGWCLLLGPAAGATNVGEAPPEPDEVVALEPITMNLADGRLLKIAFAMQLPLAEGEEEEVTGSVALDEMIAFLGQYGYTTLVPAEAGVGKAKLSARVSEGYRGRVMQVYFTEFAMQ